MRKVLSNCRGIGLRLTGVALVFAITTGQASTDGCAEPPEQQDSEAVAADTIAKAPAEAATRTGPAAPSAVHPTPAALLGAWQCMTRQQRADEPMFTFRLQPGDRWTDLTFGPAQQKEADYTYSTETRELRLRSAAGNALYTLMHTPAEAGQKERFVEQVPQEELYRAQVCYRYDGPLAQ